MDTYSGTAGFRRALFSAGDLAPGDHELKLVLSKGKNPWSSGNAVGIDAVEICGGAGLL
jgi:hypothetical protein